MLKNGSLTESDWIAYLSENLTSSDTVPTVEGDRPSPMLDRIAVDRISPVPSKPITEVVTSPISSGLIKERFREGIIDRSILTDLTTANLAKSNLAIQAKPEWTVAAQQVYRQVPPVPMLGDPIQVGNFLLWADPQADTIEVKLPERFVQLDPRYIKPLPKPILIDQRINPVDRIIAPPMLTANLPTMVDRATMIDRVILRPDIIDALKVQKVRVPVRRAFFTTVAPELQSFRLMVQQGQPGQATVGTALLTVSLYTKDSAELLETHRLKWTDALTQAGYGARIWKFLPINLQQLQPFLDIDAQQLRSPIQVSTNAGAGTATFLLELSEIGTQIWRQALERRQPEQITGVARFTAKFYARTDDRLQIREQNFSATLATLLSGCGSEHIEILNPTLALTTSILAQRHAFVDSTTVTWDIDRSEHSFSGTEDGVLTGVITTDNLEGVQVNWKAQVKYRFSSWSIGVQQGKLSLRNSIGIIKPGSTEWIREFTVYTVMMASPTQVATDLIDFEDLEVEAVLTFNADYLTLPLATTFKPRHLDVTEVPFPVQPGQAPKQVGITVVVRSKSSDRILAAPPPRILAPSSSLINLKVFRDGTIDVVTNIDPISESSIDGDLFDLVHNLKASDN
ncbi:hypothetical protein NC981_07030 [Leptolyngbya sp. DQ-M1]|uniref:hypothetical protein n=1 Tax=Leptolyngbya sp. DQ-M1 TaxID=2933920 RepID=UPI003298F85B